MSSSAARSDVILLLRDPEFRAYTPLSEELSVTLAEGAIRADQRSAVCSSPMLSCACGSGGGGCAVPSKLVSQKPLAVLSSETIVETRGAGAVTIVAASAVMPGSPASGGSLVRLSVLTKMSNCPTDEATEFDPTTNPLRLVFGGFNKQANGALVGNTALILGLCLLTLLVVCVYRCLHKPDVPDVEKGDVQKGSPETSASWMNTLARCKVGRLLLPACFLFGGEVAAGMSVLLYSDGAVKAAAVFALGLALGLPILTAFIVRRSTTHAVVKVREVHLEETSVCTRALSWLGWGTHEWIPNEDSSDFWEVNRLFFDGYKQHTRWWLLLEQVATAILAAMSSWEPTTKMQCWGRIITALVVLCILFIMLVALRPYLAPYETGMDSTVIAAEIVLLVFVMLTMTSDDPGEHWAGPWTGVLAQVVMWLIFAKFIIDMIVYVIDERDEWKEDGREGKPGFLPFLLCCGCPCKGTHVESSPEQTAKSNGPVYSSAGSEAGSSRREPFAGCENHRASPLKTPATCTPARRAIATPPPQATGSRALVNPIDALPHEPCVDHYVV